MIFTGTCILFLFISLIVWLTLGLAKTSKKVHKELSNFLEMAKKLKTSEELLSLHKEIVKYANEYCVVKNYRNHVREVLAYVEAKYEAYADIERS